MRKLLAVPLAIGALVVLLVVPANSATTVSVKDNFFSPKGAFSVKFNNKGKFAYRCTIHPGMVGTITVK